MRMRNWSVAAVLLLAGCSSVVGTPKPSIETFGLTLDQKTVSELEIASELRELDPCALVDTDVATKLGELRLEPAPLYDLADCTVAVGSNPAPLNNTLIRLSFDTSTYLDEEDKEKVGGATVYKGYSTSTDCSYAFPIELPLKEHYKPASGHKSKPVISASVSDAVGVDPCDIARQILKKPIDYAKSLPARDPADPWTRLANAHPCAVARVLPHAVGATTVESNSPFECTIDHETNERAVWFGSRRKADSTGTGFTVVHKDGFELNVVDNHDTDGTCVAFYSTDDEIDLNLPGKDRTADGIVYPTIRVNAKCDEIADFAANVIRAAGF